jgi:hypothetical protein
MSDMEMTEGSGVKGSLGGSTVQAEVVVTDIDIKGEQTALHQYAAKEQITKNQHFVPQFLLKNFSVGSDHVVHIYDSKRDKLRPPTTVARVLSENYFYDDDNVIENFLAIEIEKSASEIIGGIIKSPTNIIESDKVDLLRFISTQLNRTPRALSASMEMIEKFSDNLIYEIGLLNGFEKSEIDRIKLKINDPRNLLALQVLEGSLQWILLKDLSFHLIINKTEIPFVISDHPVIKYNWYLRNSADISYTSLTNCGLKIFLPISSDVTICLYDKNVYKIGDKYKNYSLIASENDSLWLNELQFRSRDSYMIFSSSNQSQYVKKSCNTLDGNSLHKNNHLSTNLEDSDSNEIRSTSYSWVTQKNIKYLPSFIKIKRRIQKKPILCYERDPDAVFSYKKIIHEAREKRRLTQLNAIS